MWSDVPSAHEVTVQGLSNSVQRRQMHLLHAGSACAPCCCARKQLKNTLYLASCPETAACPGTAYWSQLLRAVPMVVVTQSLSTGHM